LITIPKDTRGQAKSLQLKQRPIDRIEGKSAKDPPLKHVHQDGEKKEEDAHKVNGGKGHDKEKSRRLKLSFEELLAKYKKKA
jgi:hypothetical protein